MTDDESAVERVEEQFTYLYNTVLARPDDFYKYWGPYQQAILDIVRDLEARAK